MQFETNNECVCVYIYIEINKRNKKNANLYHTRYSTLFTVEHSSFQSHRSLRSDARGRDESLRMDTHAGSGESQGDHAVS